MVNIFILKYLLRSDPRLLIWAGLVGWPAGAEVRVVETGTHRFQEMAPGVYFAIGTGQVLTASNALVIVTSSDVIVADSHVTAQAAQALVGSIREVTERPVRFLINTHFHYDHVHGNEGFPAGVSIIGHEFTREALLDNPLQDPIYQNAVSRSRGVAETLRSRIAAEPDAGAKKRMEEQLARLEGYIRSLVETKPVPPDLTLDRKLTLHRDGRAIEIIFLGRGHTGGDVVVFLPKEKLLFTGDLLLPMPSYLGDGYIDEWIETLEKLKKLDFDLVLPGHGDAFRDRSYFDAFQKLLAALWDQFSELHRKGVPPEEAVRQVDLSEALSFYPAESIPQHIKQLDPRLARRTFKRLEELRSRRE